MSILPSTVFHFTTKEGLKGILSDNFWIKYCIEMIEHPGAPIEIAIPMVSFCDIKLSQIQEHIEKYGSYGIGLSKEWAFESDLNPVLYMNSNSSLFEGFINFVRNGHKYYLQRNIGAKEYLDLSNVVRYMKAYRGKLIRKNKIIIDDYLFADEREWRYVPKTVDAINPSFMPFLRKEDYSTPELKEAANNKLINERLKFNANQIQYIIVKKEEERNEIIDHIRTVKGKNYTEKEIDRLTSRILSIEGIIKDF